MMSRPALCVSLIALMFAAACATEDRAVPAPAPVVVVPPAAVTPAPPAAAPAVVVPTPSTLRPGSGRIEYITAIAAAGGTASGSPTRRVGIKMDDGTVQYVDTDAVGLAVGDRVQLTADGHLRRPAP